MRVMDGNESVTETEETETSVTTSSNGTPDSPGSDTPPPPFGTYNPGPICVVCEGCALVLRRLAATTENGLGVDREYAVYPERVELPPSPTPGATESVGSVSQLRLAELDDEIYLPPGVLIPFDEGYTEETPEAEVQAHDCRRVEAGLPAYTALEYAVNLRWAQYFMPTPATERDEERAARHEQEMLQELRRDPEYGRKFRGIAALQDEMEAKDTLERLAARGPDAPFTVEPALHELANNHAHALSLEITYRKAQVVTLRRQSRASIVRINNISRAWEDEDEMDPEERDSWDKARELNSENRFRLGSHLEWLRMETDHLVHARTAVFEQTSAVTKTATKTTNEAATSQAPKYGAPSITCTHMGVRILTKTAQYWENMSPIMVDQIEAAEPPASDRESDTDSNSTADYDSRLGLGGLTLQEQADQIHHIESMGRPANNSYLNEDYLEHGLQIFATHADLGGGVLVNESTTQGGDLLVAESYNSLVEPPVQARTPSELAQAQNSDELVLRSIIMAGKQSAERCDVRIDCNHRLYYQISELPAGHYLNRDFQIEHEAALRTALMELAHETGDLSLLRDELEFWT
ncbi:hypothetical protein C8J57DRAFT_1225726 [Mycena rebaudengoi]|nr:hypothetical protein C8J57DRAFT_1225726 [Mycena rebaudengoi]